MKKLFTNDGFFLAMVLCAVVGGVISCLISIICWDTSDQALILTIIKLLCVMALYISYKKHSKNVMKGLMGALLMAQLTVAINYLSSCYIPADRICYPILLILSALLFINHFIINSDHKASPAMVRINQLIILAIVLDCVAICITWSIAYPIPLAIFVDVLGMIAAIGSYSAVVCIESRLDAYRLDREAAGWTEEAGYPEGYVHEYQKRK